MRSKEIERRFGDDKVSVDTMLICVAMNLKNKQVGNFVSQLVYFFFLSFFSMYGTKKITNSAQRIATIEPKGINTPPYD